MAYLTPDKTTTLSNGLVVREYLLTVHNPKRITLPTKRTAAQPLIGVTLHNTGWLDVAAATTPAEQYTRATVNGNMGDTRVHYYTDDKGAWRNLGNEYTSWHAATGGRGQGNCNTISIECIMRNTSDTVSMASMENAAKLIAWIFGEYGWTCEKNLFTHNYWTNYKDTGVMSADIDAQSLKKCTSKVANASGKYCPIYILPQWEKFKALVKKYMGTSASAVPTPTPPSKPTAFTPYTVKVTCNPLNVRKGAGTNYAACGAIKDKGVYTIVGEANGPGAKMWGKLKSGAGWISLDYTKKV